MVGRVSYGRVIFKVIMNSLLKHTSIYIVICKILSLQPANNYCNRNQHFRGCDLDNERWSVLKIIAINNCDPTLEKGPYGGCKCF